MSELQDGEEVTFYVTLKYKYTKTGEELQKYYDTRNLAEAAEIDRSNFVEEPEFILEDIFQNGRDFEITVNTVKVTE